ncbi:MAG: enoyl-CoA hydratase/isomerase family protein [Microthrixaceae bacterium]
MPATHLPFDELLAWIEGRPSSGPVLAPGDPPVVVVDLDEHDGSPVPDVHGGLPVVVVGLTAAAHPHRHLGARACDIVLGRDDVVLSAIEATVAANPMAGTALARLLRGAEERSIEEGLLVESATYSALQAGPEFATWLAGHRRRERLAEPDPVLLERHGSELTITLNRPAVRNALNIAMRDRLLDALEIAATDPSVTDVHLQGAGAAFCAGGDLDEFGTFTDPAAAHLIRLERSIGRSIAAVADRVTAHLHGACAGSGIELPAFAGRVVADPSTVISLPEVGLGLVPGAGGTVSLPRRIGRHRTALLGLSGVPVSAGTARAWGLVDELAGSTRA